MEKCKVIGINGIIYGKNAFKKNILETSKLPTLGKKNMNYPLKDGVRPGY